MLGLAEAAAITFAAACWRVATLSMSSCARTNGAPPLVVEVAARSTSGSHSSPCTTKATPLLRTDEAPAGLCEDGRVMPTARDLCFAFARRPWPAFFGGIGACDRSPHPQHNAEHNHREHHAQLCHRSQAFTGQHGCMRARNPKPLKSNTTQRFWRRAIYSDFTLMLISELLYRYSVNQRNESKRSIHTVPV